MTNAIQSFDFHFKPVRGIALGGHPWFMALDVAGALEFPVPAEAVRKHCPKATVYQHHVTGGLREYTIIAEEEIRALADHVRHQLATEFLEWMLWEAFPKLLSPAVTRPANDLRFLPAVEVLAEELGAGLVTLHGQEMLTTTLAVAQGTENEHASVILLVRKYVDDLREFGQVDFKSTRPESGGHPVEFAFLNEDQATLLLTYMRNNDVVRAFKKALVKAFRVLVTRAAAPAFQVPQSLGEALRLAADLEERRAVLLVQVTQQATTIQTLEPKAAALERISNHTGQDMSITTAAKTLKVPPQKLFDWMERQEWTYRRGGRLTAYQDKIHAGYLTHHAVVITHTDGTPGSVNQLMVTPKGLARLGELLAKGAR